MGHNSILVAGDLISDVYVDGPIDVANEGGGPRLNAHGKRLPEVRRGGVGFVRDALASFAPDFDIHSDCSSKSTITRYRNEKKETIFTLDRFQHEIDFRMHLHRGYAHDCLVVWDDNRVSDGYDWSWIWEGVKPDALVVVDSENIEKWDLPAVDYIKLTGPSWDGTWPKNGARLIATGADNVLVDKDLYRVNKIDNPVDTVGAGDVFTAVFVTMLLEGATESEATKEAIRYSRESVNHHGCVIPNRE